MPKGILARVKWALSLKVWVLVLGEVLLPWLEEEEEDGAKVVFGVVVVILLAGSMSDGEWYADKIVRSYVTVSLAVVGMR